MPSRRCALPALFALFLTVAGLSGAPGAAQTPADDGGPKPADAPAALRAAFDDPRPPAAAYTVIDGARIDAPLSAERGDPARGRALFADPEAAGCVACHAAPGLPRRAVAPRVLRDRLPPLPDVADGEEEDGEGEVEAASAAPSGEGPAASPLPRANPRRAGADPAEATAEAEPPGGPRPPLLPLPAGPDLGGVAARLSEGALRLIVVDPRLRDPAAPKPAYHAVSLERAAIAPGLRQPWLSALQVEDVVAYLVTLDGAAQSPGPDGGAEADRPARDAPPAGPASGPEAPPPPGPGRDP